MRSNKYHIPATIDVHCRICNFLYYQFEVFEVWLFCHAFRPL
eukprot:XP_001706408.1 Hypothetical protein GL50803_8101 [Giardia lamblia ATCC 50803]